jgi:hypothetical protein
MTHALSKRNLVGVLTIALLLLVAVPATSFGKDRGRRGRGRDHNNWKCGKFVNCHDARDGRWDGRGPRRNLTRWDWRNNDGRWDRWRDRRTRDDRWWDNRSGDSRWWNSRTGDNRWRDGRLRNNTELRERYTRRFQNRDRWR